MFHHNRIWCLAEVDLPEDLAKKLTELTWCCCQAFKVKGHDRYAWLNDSTSADGAQEYAVVKLSRSPNVMTQIETITFGWCNYGKALKFTQEALAGKDDNNDFAIPVTAVIQAPSEHGSCPHCA